MSSFFSNQMVSLQPWNSLDGKQTSSSAGRLLETRVRRGGYTASNKIALLEKNGKSCWYILFFPSTSGLKTIMVSGSQDIRCFFMEMLSFYNTFTTMLFINLLCLL